MTKKTIIALIGFAAAGDAEGARRHLGFTYPRRASLEPIRHSLERHCTPGFYEMVMASIPWLKDEIFEVALTPTA